MHAQANKAEYFANYRQKLLEATEGNRYHAMVSVWGSMQFYSFSFAEYKRIAAFGLGLWGESLTKNAPGYMAGLIRNYK